MYDISKIKNKKYLNYRQGKYNIATVATVLFATPDMTEIRDKITANQKCAWVESLCKHTALTTKMVST